MGLGPVEVIVIAFPGNQFTGEIIPELERLVKSETINIIDGLLVIKDANGVVTFAEFDEVGGASDAAELAKLFTRFDELVSDDDVNEIAQSLDNNCSAAIMVFENTWATPLRNAIVNSGGILAMNFRVPAVVVDDILESLASMN
jgi:uncharacterized membrane protein